MASTCIGCQVHKRMNCKSSSGFLFPQAIHAALPDRYSLPKGASFVGSHQSPVISVSPEQLGRKSSEIRTSILTSSWTSPVTGDLSTNTRRHRSRKSQAWKRLTVRFQPNSPRDLINSLPQTVVYSTSSPHSDPFPSLDLWHSDVSYELQPPSTTSLKLLTGPEAGGDTLWSSGYALYSSLSPGLQVYLEGLTALHSAVAQADGARAAGIPVRREPIETVHPVIRVHPATGWKSVYVNPGGCSLLTPTHPRSLTCNLYPAWDRLHAAHRGRAKSRVRRNTCVSIRSDLPEPRFSSPFQVGAE